MPAIGSLSSVPVRPGLPKRERPPLRLTSTSGGGKTASFGYDGAGNMTSVSGTMFGAWTLVYDDESRLNQVTYPSGGESVTDLYYYSALGQRMRARLSGTYWRYIYNGDRVLEETNDTGGPLARHTTESGSYYAPWLHMQRAGGISRFPLYDGVGSTRRLVDENNNHTDAYSLLAFGPDRGGWQGTTNPYRFGGAWAYTTDPSGLLQSLGPAGAGMAVASGDLAIGGTLLLARTRPLHPTGPNRR